VKNRKTGGISTLLRGFSITSLIATVIAALVIAILHRQVSIAAITDLGEHSNQALARIIVNSVQPNETHPVSRLGSGMNVTPLPCSAVPDPLHTQRV
jgi:hypothetical protein